MEIVEQNDDDMMECDVQEDDLLGEEVLAMENVQPHSLAISSSTQELKKGNRPADARKRASVPLGIENKKAEFLRWGSPRVSSMSPMPKDSNKSRQRLHSSKKGRSNKAGGLMGPKYPWKHHP